MKRDAVIWTIILLVAGVWIAWRAAGGAMGQSYVKVAEVASAVLPEGTTQGDLPSDMSLATNADGQPIGAWVQDLGSTKAAWAEAEVVDPAQKTYRLSPSRTIGLWIGAFFTLAIMSFLYRDNPFYKVAESVVVGVSAGYWMVVGFWDVVIPNLLGKLWPSLVKANFVPGMSEVDPNWWYLCPLVLGIMLIWRLSPVGGWISRWPLAFIIGSTAGLRIYAYVETDFVNQINSTIVPLIDMQGGSFDFWASFRAIVMVVGVFACLVYFFFSVEHKGAVGKTARLGIWYLMVTFGAAFGYTVMGRIALLAQRLEFLFDDWLWLVDPSGARAVIG